MARNYRLPKDYKESDIKYSVRDLSLSKATTLMQCLHIPIYGECINSHDKFRIDFSTLLQSNALVTPLFGRYKMRVTTFNAPLMNYYGWMDNNTKLTPEEFDAMQHWTISPAWRQFIEVTAPGAGENAFERPENYALNRGFVAASVLPSIPNGWLVAGMDSSDEMFQSWREQNCVQPGSFLDYMGFPVGYFYTGGLSVVEEEAGYFSSSTDEPAVGTECWSFKADMILAYLDSVRSYLVNNQLSYALYTVSAGKKDADGNIVSWGIFDESANYYPIGNGEQQAMYIPLESIDKFFMWLRSKPYAGDLLATLWDDKVNGILYEPWMDDIMQWLCSLRFGGMFCCQYEADMLQNLLTDIQGAEAYVDVVNGKVSINDFRMANRRQRRRERVAISGGRYKDLLRTLWGAKSRSGVDIPDFVNTTSYIIDPRNVISTADTSMPSADGDPTGASIGQMAGNVNQFNGGKSRFIHRFQTEDPSFCITLVSLVPEVLYSDGIDKNLLGPRFSDDYSPQFDQVGFQDVPSALYNWKPVAADDTDIVGGTSVEDVQVVGKNVAWNKYLSNVSRCHGLFARGQDMDSYVLSRDYTRSLSRSTGARFDIESAPNGYALPMDYQYMYQVTKSTFPNWFFQIDFNIRAVRAIGKNYMPTLGK